MRKANIDNTIPPLPQYDEKLLDLGVLCNSPHNKPLDRSVHELYCIRNSSKPKFLILGDSHALSFAYSAAISNSLDLAMIELSSHQASINYISYTQRCHDKARRIQELKSFNEGVNAMLESYSSIEYVILLSRGPVYFTGEGFGIEKEDPAVTNLLLERADNTQPMISRPEAFVRGYVERIKFLQEKGKKVIFAIDFPELGENPSLCFKRTFSLTRNLKSCLVERYAVDLRQKEYRELIQQIQQQTPGLLVYDPISAFCGNNHCYGKRGDMIYYADDDHLNLEGSKLINNHFKEWFTREVMHNK
jgi:hypothetical protein